MKISKGEPVIRNKTLMRLMIGLIAGSCFGILSCLVISVSLNRSVAEVATKHGNMSIADHAKLDSSSSIDLAIRSILEDTSSSMRFQDIYAYSDEIDRDKLVELIDLSMVVDWNPNTAGMQELLLGEFARREPTEALNKTFRFPQLSMDEVDIHRVCGMVVSGSG